MKLTLRGLTITIAEIVIDDALTRPVGAASTNLAPVQPPREGADGGNAGGGHVDPQDGQPNANADESPAAGEKAVPPAGGEHAAVTVEAEVARVVPLPTVLADPDVIALRLATVGAQVRNAVDNPPPPVERPAELALTRPPVEEDTLEFPACLDRRQERAHG